MARSITVLRSLGACCALLLALAVLLPATAGAQDALTVVTEPASIRMGTQYDGIDLKITGNVPAGSDVVVRFTGAPAKLHLRRKGKVFGLLWMNVGKVTVDNVPKVCLVDSSAPYTQLAPAAESYRLEGLRDDMKIEEGADSADLDIVHELLLLKESEGLYSENAGGVVLGPDEGGSRTFSATLPVPSALSPSDYVVQVMALRDGAVIGTASTPIHAELVGFPAWLSHMAFDNALLYGILATVIAILSGLAIGMIFQSKGAH